jgi:hypothetical protein
MEVSPGLRTTEQEMPLYEVASPRGDGKEDHPLGKPIKRTRHHGSRQQRVLVTQGKGKNENVSMFSSPREDV